MYTYYICFWYYSAVERCRVTHQYSIIFDFNECKIDLEKVRTAFIAELKKDMIRDKATQFYIHKSGILPTD